MKLRVPKLPLLFATVAFALNTSGKEALLGDWVGGFEQSTRDYLYLQLHFRSSEEQTIGTYDAPLLFQSGRTLTQLTLEDTRFRFDLGEGEQTQSFAGTITNGTLSGSVRIGNVEKPFKFARIASIDPKQYVGIYMVAQDHYVFIRPGLELGLGALQYIDYKTGSVGVLFPTSTTNFFTGPGLLIPFPTVAAVAFNLSDPGTPAIEWTGAEKWSARRVRLPTEEFQFTNDTIRISGTLILPRTPPPHPVVLCVAGGTGAATRDMFRHIAEFFAASGVASVVYDKRGLGGSTGNWLKADFHDLAEDAVAGVQALKTHPKINRSRIGLFGASQSGWIVALAASKSEDVAFIISQSGPGVTPKEQELYRSEAWLRADGFTEAEISDAMKYIGQRYECAEKGQGWEALAEVEREARKARWFPYTGGSAGKDHPFWEFWNLIRDYDPVPVMEKVKCPVLSIFGEKDTFLPVEKSAQLWRTALDRAENKAATIRVFPRADHSLIESETGGLKAAGKSKRFVPGFFDLLRDWTLEQTR